MGLSVGDANSVVESNSDQGIFTGEESSAREASLARPEGMVVDADGNIFIADTGNALVRRVDRESGLIETVLGSTDPSAPPPTFSLRVADEVRLVRPFGLAFDPIANELFVTDAGTNQFMVVDLTANTVRTININITASRPRDLAFHQFDDDRIVFVGNAGMTGNPASVSAFHIDLNFITPLDFNPTGGVDTSVRGVLGLTIQKGSDNSANLFVAVDRGQFLNQSALNAVNFEVNCFDGIDDDGDGLVDLADSDCREPIRVELVRFGFPSSNASFGNTNYQGIVTGYQKFPTVQTQDTCGGGPVIIQPLNLDFEDLVIASPTVDSKGNIVFIDPSTSCVFRLDTTLGGDLIPLIGTVDEEALSFDGGNPLVTRLERPNAIQLDDKGNLYIADTGNNRLRRAWVGAFLEQ